MKDKLIERVDIELFDGGSMSSDALSSKDVIVRLKNGRVIQISPDFNCINIWDKEAHFEDFLVGEQTVVSFDMGGNACGEFHGSGVSISK